ncbi:MAG TPA: aldo/keto reductase [Bryobacteraceae bacterium]|nr:aldo/keto reductase [Bryobacteraceae bacterium]
MNRREFFIRGGTLAGAAALNAFPYHLYASAAKKSASDRVQLGPMKVSVSRLAMGTGTNGVGGSSNQTRKLGLGGVADMLKAGYDQGITFFDSADQYGTHPHVREALKRVPREKIALLTKTHASTEKEMRADLDRFRKELGTDYIDIVLLHCMMDAQWNERKKGAMNYLAQAREKGIVKTHGVSCHTIEALRTAAKEPWVQVDLARINPAGIAMDADPNTVLGVLREMKAAGKGVIGMKILGAGRLRNKVDESLQFALAQNVVDCFTIGAESREELAGLVQKIPAASVRA